MLAVIYVRVSTEDQARHGYSLEAQEEACRKKAAELGAKTVEVYKDEGYTGEILERPGLQAALSAAKSAAFFIAYDPDRLSRKLAHQLLLVETIEKAGCRLEFVTMDWQDTPEGRLFYSLRGAIAEYEREKIKARSTFGKLAKARRGLLTHDPRIYGYRYSEGRLEVDEEQAEVYRRMVSMALGGESPEGIANTLNSEGVPAPGGGKWYRATVRRILKNPTYTGTLYLHRYNAEGVKAARQRGQRATPKVRPRDEWISVSVPPLIDPHKWAELQDVLAAAKAGRRGARVYPYYLSGLVTCGLCGYPMTGQCGRSRTGRVYRYYACSNAWERSNADRKESRPICSNGMHRAEVLEEAVWAKVREWLEDPEALIAELKHDQTREAIEKERAQVEKRLEQLAKERERVFLAYRHGLVDLETFREAVNDIDAERKRNEQRLAELEKAMQATACSGEEFAAFRALAEEVAGYLDELDWSEKERLIRLLVRRVKVSSGQIVVEAKLNGDVSPTGTAIHIVDPKNPGAVDEIVHLGDFWDEVKMREHKQEIMEANARVNRLFRTAYSALKEAKVIRDEWESYVEECINEALVNRAQARLLDAVFAGVAARYDRAPKARHLFATAITPEGIITGNVETLLYDVERIYTISGEPGSGVSRMLERVASFAAAKGLFTEIYHCPFNPDNYDLVIIPEIKVAVMNVEPPHTFDPTPFNHLIALSINLSEYIDKNKLGVYTQEILSAKFRYQACLDRAVAYIRQAKLTHDYMESFYIPAMNFEAINAKREEILQRILRYAAEFDS